MTARNPRIVVSAISAIARAFASAHAELFAYKMTTDISANVFTPEMPEGDADCLQTIPGKGRNSLLSVACATFLLTSISSAVSAQSGAEEDWEFTIAPYLWAAGISGQAATIPGLPPVGVDSSFSDILDNLKIAGMVFAGAHKGRWGITGDLQYIDLENSTTALQPAYSLATVKATNTTFSLYGEYQLGKSSKSELWGAFGVRYWDVETTLSFAGGILPGVAAGGGDSWIDPVLGLRGRVNLTDRTYLTGWAYVGGFDVGSKKMADIFGAVGYQFTPTTSAVLGYRWLMVDRQSGAFTYDVEMDGLLAGLKFTF